MSGHHHKSLLVCKLLKISFKQLILHPVLYDLPSLTICNKLIRIQRYLMVQIVVYHYLERFSFYASASVFVYRFSIDSLFWHVSVSVNPSSCHEFFHELRSKLFMKVFRYVSESVFEGELYLSFIKVKLSHRSSSYTLFELRIFRQRVIEFDGHCI